jgi:hypothetical protein
MYFVYEIWNKYGDSGSQIKQSIDKTPVLKTNFKIIFDKI